MALAKLRSLYRHLRACIKPRIHAETQVAATHMRPETEQTDARDCGLIDSVQSGWFQGETGELFTGFAIREGNILLDAGCGGGGAALFAARQGAHVIFSDIVSDKLADLRERIAQTRSPGAMGIVSDSAPLPLADESFSHVVALEMLEHVEDPAAVLRELVRVGKPGAYFLISVPDARAEHIQKKFAPPFYFDRPNHIHIFERDEFARLVQEAGLHIEQHTTYSFYWAMWMMIYWTWANSTGREDIGESLDVTKPPHPDILNDWTQLWHKLIKMPEAAPLKHALDELLPKSQVIVARKPCEHPMMPTTDTELMP